MLFAIFDVVSLGFTDSLLVSVGIFVLLGFALYKLYTKLFGDGNSSSSSSVAPAYKVIHSESTQNSMSADSKSADDGSFVSKMIAGKRNLIVFFGSQTGTAEDFSQRVCKEAAKIGMRGMVADPEEYEMDQLTQLDRVAAAAAESSDASGGGGSGGAGAVGPLVVFCVATYGEGDPTDNAQEFHAWLESCEDDLSMVHYCVFGLGNKTYEHYNTMGVYVDRRLAELGAKRVYPLGLGDDDSNIEEHFLTWKEGLWPAVCEYFGLSGDHVEFRSREYELCEWDSSASSAASPSTTAVPPPPEKVFSGEITRLGAFRTQRPPFDAKNPFLATVMVNRELFQDASERQCMHIELDISGSNIRYDSGDHVAIYPTNDAQLVSQLAERLKIPDLDRIISLNAIDSDNHKKHPFPCPTSYRTAFTHYVDICHPPRTNVLGELAEYAGEPEHREFLRRLASTEGKAEYQRWILDARRHLLQVLRELPSVAPPADHVLELLPRLQARYYSISSSPALHRTAIHVTAVMVEYTTSAGCAMRGVATGYLAGRRPQQAGQQEPSSASEPRDDKEAELEQSLDTKAVKVPIFVRHSQFHLPFRPNIPVIMVGPGTGFAPFRGFLQERRAKQEAGHTLGDTVLYFGCRNRERDWIYREEMQRYVELGTLSKLYTAFSRDPRPPPTEGEAEAEAAGPGGAGGAGSGQKVYVQTLMRREENRREIWRLIGEQNGHLYICGDAKNMAVEVRDTLLDIFVRQGGMADVAEAEQYLKRMQKKGRYGADVWS